MSDIEDKINSILSSPEDMEKIAEIAKSFMGGENSSTAESLPGFENIDPDMVASIGKMLSGAQTKNENTALLEALKPFLKEKRRSKIDRAVQIAKMAKMAGIAFTSDGGD